MIRRLHCASVMLTLLFISSTGCSTTKTIRPDFVYFPSPPAKTRAIHLKSFNRLHDLIPHRGNIKEWLRGELTGPYVSRPAGIAYANHHLYICDAASSTLHDWDLHTGTSKYFGSASLSGSTNLTLKKPVAVAVDDRGYIYVADTDRREVICFDNNGTVIVHFKPENRERYKPTAVAVHETTLYVTDAEEHTVDLFYINNGQHIGSIGSRGNNPGKFYFPTGVAIQQRNRLIVSDMLNSRVQVFDTHQTTGKQLLLSMGQPGNGYGDMGKPKHVAVGPDGVIFVADSEFGHIHLYNEKGKLLMLLGGPQDKTGNTPLPFGVAIAKKLPETIASWIPDSFQLNYYLFVTNSLGEKRINLFAIGQERP